MIALATPDTQASRLDSSDGFLTQKELDPDAVAFNSQNNRYHFPARFLLPTRGVFARVDPLLFGRFPKLQNVEPILLYQYVLSNPTLFTDPFGLEECEPPRELPKSTQEMCSLWIELDPNNFGEERYSRYYLGPYTKPLPKGHIDPHSPDRGRPTGITTCTVPCTKYKKVCTLWKGPFGLEFNTYEESYGQVTCTRKFICVTEQVYYDEPGGNRVKKIGSYHMYWKEIGKSCSECEIQPPARHA
jgi:hypothetical protein